MKMYGYVAFYNRRRIEVKAASLYEAKQAAIKILKPKKRDEHMVTVLLSTDQEGTPVPQSTGAL